MEIVGIRVESFENRFLPKYANLRKAWMLSEVCDDLDDFGDLVFEVRRRENQVANELSKIAQPLAIDKGLELPIPA